MRQRTSLTRLMMGLLLASLSLFSSSPTHEARAADDATRSVAPIEQPLNVVIIYADDLGYGDLGCFGHPKFKTPHLDQLAKDGARLTHFYSSCPFCAPSRASLLTGRYPFRNGMLGNPVPAEDYGVAGKKVPGDELGIRDEETLLGELLQTANYRTSCIGKWHLGHKPRFYPVKHGFDEYFGILYSNDMHPVQLFRNDQKFEFPVDQTGLTRRYTEAALSFLSTNRDRPFFLYLPHAMPHKPLAASDAFYHQSKSGLYGDVIAELDWSVGEVLKKLDELQLRDRTLVFFTSDNGPWFGGSSGGLRGMKSQWWEGGIRVPFIARLPGVIPAGHVSAEPAIIMDLFSTVLTATKVSIPADRIIDGRDIMPLLTSQERSPHRGLLCVSGEVRSVRSGSWKLHLKGTPPPGMEDWAIDWKDPRAPNGTTILAQKEQYLPDAYPGAKTGDRSKTPALFNLATDPSEQHNLAADHPDVVRELQSLAAQLQSDK